MNNKSVVDLSGQTFGRLLVLGRAGNQGKYAAWECICLCGTSKVVNGRYLRRGETTSCGCAKREALAANQFKPGHPGYNAAKVYCHRGHRLSGDNLYTTPNGQRACKACQRDYRRASSSRPSSQMLVPVVY